MSNDNQIFGEQEQQEPSTVKKIKRKRASEQDQKKKVISAITGTVMLAGVVAPILPVQGVQAAPTTTTGTLTADKYYVAAGESVEITITDAGNNFNTNPAIADTTQVAVSSSADTTEGRNPLMLTLTETGPNTGVFKGTLGLVDPSTAAPAANQIRVVNGGTVSILDPNWNTTGQLNPIVLNVERRDHVTGTIQTFDAVTSAPVSNLVHNGQVIRVELRDDDLNTNPTTVQTKAINVTAVAGEAGYALTLRESSANSNLFVGEFTVGTDIAPANNSPLYLEYLDDNKVDNTSGLITKKLVRKDLSSATLSALPTKAAFHEPVVVTLTDNDLNIDTSVAETATVKVTSAEDPVGISLTLTETGPDTGVFTGTFTMEAASNAASNQIKSLNGGTVTVSYTDLRDENGSTASISRTIVRKDNVSGTVAVDKRYAVVGENVTITVNDADYINNTAGETLNVQVASASDAAGISVVLTETADTGVFKGTFKVTGGASIAGSQIRAANGDAITVTYIDAITATNAVNQPVTTILNRKDRVTGTLAYDRLSSPTGEIIEVTLNDTDLDVDADVTETAQVMITSSDDPEGFFLTLTETGTGTGVFKGQFKPDATATNESLSPQTLKAAYNSNMTVTYTDEHRADNTRGNVVRTFQHLQVPVVTSAVAVNAGGQVGAGLGDTVTFSFDMNTNQPVINAADLAAFYALNEGSWGTVAGGLSGSWANAQQFVITLGSDATVKKGATVTLASAAGIKDAAGNSAASVGAFSIGGTFGSQVPAFVSITAADTGGQVGAGAGDTITLIFDTPTNQPVVALDALKLSAGSLGTAANGAGAVWNDTKTLVVTLGSDATVKKGATLTLDASANIQDIGVESGASIASGTIDGTFGSQVPSISSVIAADAGNQVGSGAGDTITIVFDTPTNKAAVTVNSFVLTAGTLGTGFNGTVLTWSDAKTLVITLGSDANVKKGATLTLAASAGIRDIGNESAVSTAGGVIGGTFGSQVPAISSITAANTGNQVGAGAGDTVEIVFDTPTNQPAVNVADLELSAGSFGTGASAAWTNAKTLVVTLGTGATVKKGANLQLAAGTGITDIGLESAESVSSGTIGGTFGSQVPTILSITAADVGNQPGAGAGDTVTISFDTATSQPAVALTDLVLDVGSFGTGATAVWTNATTLVVTLGSDATVKRGATLTLAAAANIQDIGQESLPSTANAAIGGTFGSQVPGITSITASNDGGQIGAGVGDKVTIVFNTETNQPTVALANLTLSAGSFGAGSSAAWTNETTLVVTLGTGATVKKGATLTLAAAAGIQDKGQESVPSTANAVIGGTFGSQVPGIVSITATDAGNQPGAGAGDKVTIIFNTETSQPAVALTDLVLNVGSFGTAGNGTSVAWTDATTLVVTLGSDATVKKGATLTLAAAANIQDIGQESVPSTANAAIGGTFGSQVPGITSITASNDGGQIGAGAGDKVTIVFDTATSQPTVALTNLTLSAGSFGTGALTAWTNETTLVVTLGTGATVKKGATLTLAAAANIQDKGQESLPSTANAVIGGTFGSQVPAITSITAADAGNQVGAGAGDTVTIVFDTATSQPTVGLDSLGLSAGSFGTAGFGATIVWSNATTLVVTLGSDATVKKGATLTLAASGNIQDIGQESLPSTSSAVITGTFGSQVPSIVSITAAEDGPFEVGAGAGDTISIVFDTATNRPSLTLADLVLSAGSFGTAGNGASVAWTDAKTLVVTLGSDATVKKGATLSLGASSNILDVGAESAASTGGGTIVGTFGSRVPLITSITAADTGNQVGAGAGDKVTIVFDTATNQPVVNVSNLTLTAGSFGAGATAAWTDATTLVVTLGTGATVKKGATLTLTAAANIQDIGVESAASTASAAIGGTFGSQVPAITSITAADAGNQVGAGPGDTVTIVFDTETNEPIVDVADLVLSAGSFGDGAISSWSNATTLVVTLGTNATVRKDATLTLAATARIQDIGQESAFSISTGTIAGTFGVGSVPVITSITATDAGGQVGAGAGDKVNIVFDTATSQPVVALADLVLGAGSFGTGATTAWTSATTLVVTLGSDATVKKGATLTLAATANIKDIGAESAASLSSGTIDGTFGSQVPGITSITASNDGNQVGAGAGDKVTIVFDTATNRPAVAVPDLRLSAGSFGTGAAAAWTDATTLVVTLGTGATVKKGATLTLEATANIQDIGTESAASTANGAIGGTFGSQVPGIESITAVNTGNQVGAGAGDQVTIVLDTETNQPTVTLAHLVLSAGSFGTAANGATVGWTDSKTLLVTLGSDATVKKGATVTFDNTANIRDIGEESAASVAVGTIAGTFGSQVPAITSITAANTGAQPGPNAGDTVTIVFNTPTNQATFGLENLLLDVGSFGTAANGASLSWTDRYTLRVTLGSDATVRQGAQLSIAPEAGLRDIGEESAASTANGTITGTFGIGAVPAVVAIQATNDAGGPGAESGDKVEISFTAVTNKPVINLADLTLSSGHTWGAGATASWNSTGSSLVITLGTSATVAVGDQVTISVAAGIKDISAESAAITATAPITGTFGELILPFVSNVLATNGGGTAAVEKDDTLEIIFNVPTNGGVVDLSKLVVSNGHHLGTSPSTQWSADHRTLTVKLGSDPTIVLTDTLDILAGIGIKDETGTTEIAPAANIAIHGSFGVAVAPQVVNVYATNGDGLPTVGAGDTLVVVFDTPTNGGAVDLSTFTLSNGHSFGASPAQAWSADRTRLTITLGAGATITTADTLTIGVGSGIQDATNQAALTTTAALSIGGSFGVAVAPTVSSVTAINGDGKASVGAGDKLVFVLDAPSNGANVDLTKFIVSNGHGLGTGAAWSWSSDKLRLTVTLGTGATVTTADTISIAAGSGIVDATGTAPLAATAALSIGGSFGVAVAPVVTSVTAVNKDGQPGAGAGDQLRIVFDTPTYGGAVDLNKILVSNGHNLGTGAAFAWSENNAHLTITLGANPTITAGDTISFLASSGITDATNQAGLAAQANIAIRGNFGVAVAPQVVNVYATNGDGLPTVGAGDTLVVVFDTPTNGGAVDLSTFTLSNGHSFGASPAQAWSADRTRLTITLGAGATITTADTLTIGVGSGIQDASGQAALTTTAALNMGGSFGVAVAPVVSSVTAINGDGKASVGAGDQLVFVLDAPSNGANVDLTKFIVSNGHGLGAGAAWSWSSDKLRLTVTLGTGATVTTADTVSIAAGSGITDTTGTAPLTATSALSIGGSFGFAVAPVVTSVTAVNKDGKPGTGVGDQLRIVFDTPTYGGTVDLNKILVSNGHTLGTGASFAWSENNAHLTITLGENPTINAGDTLTIQASSGITDATNQAGLAATGALTVYGSFGVAIAPQVAALQAIDGDGTARITTGDKLAVIFDTPVKLTGFSLNNILANGSPNPFGSTATYALDASGTRLTVTFGGTGISITPASVITINGGIYDQATGTQALSGGTSLPAISGSFGTAIAPNVLSAVAMDQNKLESIYGDKIVITFDSPTNGAAPVGEVTKDLIRITNSSNHTIGNYASFAWSNDKRELTVTLGTYGNVTGSVYVTDAVYANLQIGDILDLTGLGIKDATETVPANASSVPISGSFVPGVIPRFTQAVASTNSRNPAANILGTIDILFSTAMYQEPATIDLSKIRVSNNHTFGTGATAKWTSSTVLSITVMTDATLKVGDQIDLSQLRLKDSNGIGYLPDGDAVQTLTGSFGSTAVPTVLSVVAKDTGNNPGAGKGDTITITFGSDTNQPKPVLTNLAYLLGSDASASWLNPRTLVITVGTLGTNPILKDAAEIPLDSLNIRDVTGTSQPVQGAFVIEESFGRADAPTVRSIVASSSNKSKTTSAIGNGDKLTITFSMPTNQSGVWNKATVEQYIKFGTGAAPKILGADYQGLWKNDGQVLEITVIDVTGSTIQIGDEIQVQGIKNARGTSPANNDTVKLTGIFDGREFAITSSIIAESARGVLEATLSIEVLKGHAGDEVLIFELKQGSSTPVQLMATTMDIKENTTITHTFTGLPGDLSQYTVEAYIFDNINNSSASQLLAPKVQLKLK